MSSRSILKLSNYNYSSKLPTESRREILEIIFNEMAQQEKDHIIADIISKTLSQLSSLHKKRNPQHSKIYEEDSEWIKSSFGKRYVMDPIVIPSMVVEDQDNMMYDNNDTHAINVQDLMDEDQPSAVRRRKVTTPFKSPVRPQSKQKSASRKKATPTKKIAFRIRTSRQNTEF